MPFSSRARASQASHPAEARSLAPTQNPDTAASKLSRTQGSAGAHRAAAGSAGAGGRRARGQSPGRALLTCQARWHRGGRQQQQQQQLGGQRRGRRRGQPEEAPVQAAAGHHSAAATSARLDKATASAAVGRAALAPAAGRRVSELGTSLTFLFH